MPLIAAHSQGELGGAHQVVRWSLWGVTLGPQEGGAAAGDWCPGRQREFPQPHPSGVRNHSSFLDPLLETSSQADFNVGISYQELKYH